MSAEFIETIIIGLIISLVARFIKSGDVQMSLIFTVLIGIVGAFVGLFIAQILGNYNSGNPAGLIGAIVGAIAILAIVIQSSSTRITHHH